MRSRFGSSPGKIKAQPVKISVLTEALYMTSLKNAGGEGVNARATVLVLHK